MFAENEKISVPQLKSLLFLDWTGKLLLLLPVLCRPLTGWNFLAAAALGMAWMFLYLFFTGEVSCRVQGSFSAYLKNRFGAWSSYTTGILFLIYLFWNQTYLARMTGRICRTFLLPEVSETVIAMLVLLAGVYTAAGSGQKRGRLAQCLALPLGIALTVMLAASAFAVNAENLMPDTHMDIRLVFEKSAMVFASFAAVNLVLYESPYINWKTDKRGRTLRRCAKAAPIFLILAFLTAIGTLGEKSFFFLPWPAITMMGDVNLPGNFLQRWDAVFLAFLLFSLLLTSGTCCHYAERILKELLPEKKNSHILWGIFAGMTMLIFISRTYERTAEIFSKYIVKGVVPLILALPVFLWLVERGRKKCENQEVK